ncbi:hypothetical protein [Aeromicrobium sp. UC242_57]|uniref:hypothetical protein n=1 Tax=Aeromicrobium sp. UC242_57 TaxID=3374624 RepID=UPI00379E4F3B
MLGFYLINLGFVMLFLRAGDDVVDMTGLFELLSVKVGTILLMLGFVHFINVMAFSSLRRKGRHDAARVQAPTPYPQFPAQPQR